MNLHDDIHTVHASELFGVPVEQVTKEQRRAAKARHFGIMYGMNANRIREAIDGQHGSTDNGNKGIA